MALHEESLNHGLTLPRLNGASCWKFTFFLLVSLVSIHCEGEQSSDGDADGDTDSDSDADRDGDTDEDNENDIPEGCNPLAAEWDCLLPYPSDFFLVEESSFPTGRRLAHTTPGLPLVRDELRDIVDSRPADGFSRFPNIIALFPFDLDESDLVFHTDDMNLSTTDESPTLLIEADSGRRLAHFAELDPRTSDVERRALIIHPVFPLSFSTRYVVVIRDLRDNSGAAIQTPLGYGQLRDDTASADDAVAPLVDHYENEIFPVLEMAGVNRADTLLAWDFSTASRENRTQDMVRIRELVMAALEDSPPDIFVNPDGVQEEVDENIARRLELTLEVPMFLESPEPGAVLLRNDEGQVISDGTVDVDVLIQVPRSIVEGEDRTLPGRIVQFGHGFFEDREETDRYPRQFANDTASVIVAADFWGMALQDRVPIGIDIVNDYENLYRFADRVHQAMANQIALTYAIRSTMQTLTELQVDGELVYDPDELYYYGASAGHVLGGIYVALAPHISRAALISGGCNLSLTYFRSLPFGGLLLFLGAVIEDPLDLQKFGAMSQSPIDPIDPCTYAEWVMDELLPNGPEERRILMHGGIGDAYVPNVATHMHARALGLPLIAPAPRQVYGLETLKAPLDGSGFMEFDYNLPEPTPGTYALTPTLDQDNGVHDDVRISSPSVRQIDAFFNNDGMIEAVCDGPCDPD